MSNKSRAFTLIELLVVIAIIAILAAILFPVFATAKLAAKKASDLSNMKQLQLAVIMYSNDYDDVWPLLTDFDQCTQGQHGNHTVPYGAMSRWSGVQNVGAYVKNVNLFLSPVDSSYALLDTGSYSWLAPDPATRQAGPISYMANALSNYQIGTNSPYFPSNVTDYTGPFDPGGWYQDDCVNGADVDQGGGAVSSTTAVNPSSLITFTNGAVQLSQWYGCPAGWASTETFACYGQGGLLTGYDLADLASGTSFGSSDTNMGKAWRKFTGNNGNFAFSDGHAKSMQPNQFLMGPLTWPIMVNPTYWLVNPPTQ
jgi:prepilin-type N-terminal cleavage/methylation domain-containing protein/prepilin-type processing-associated H-X9-DG protein